jgi:putative transposase
MTDDRMQLKTLLEKTADADFLNEMIGFAADRLMELVGPGGARPHAQRRRTREAGRA